MSQPTEKKENFLLNLLLNIVIPTVILTKFSGDEHLGATYGVVVALAFPITYGILDFGRAKKVNIFSALGVFSVMLTGGISLLELDPKYIAIKEAAIPGVLAIVTLVSLKTPFPLVKTLLYNDKVMQVDKVNAALEEKGTHTAFESVLTKATIILSFSFVVSSILNYVLARIIVVSPPGSEQYAVELGKMTMYSYIVIMLPTMAIFFFALFYLFKNITKLTALKLEEIIADHQ